MVKTIIAIFAGKLISFLTRMLKIGGGSAAPGLLALKIDPELVKKLASYIPQHIVITGTNGKTTTARMIAHFAKGSELKVIRNHTGSNLERGIASALISYSHLGGGILKTHKDIGIWELDEAAFNSVVPKINPQVVVFLNVFRDQLDRYGEVDSVVKRWCETLKNLPKETLVLINGDDVNTSKLAKCFTGKVQQFGVKDYKIIGESIEHKKDKEHLDFEAKDIKVKGLDGSLFRLTINDKQSLRSADLKRLTVNLPLPGIYHIYDFLAAFAVGTSLGFDEKKMILSLKHFSPAFGRVEKFSFPHSKWEARKSGFIFLIKNPAGATQVFATIAPQLKKEDRLLVALNDNFADGTDVSWIWDADFEVLQNMSRAKSRDLKLCVSGTRVYDLANRLKYAGFDPSTLIIEPDLEQAFKMARKTLKGRLFILPTYTAMLKLQSILAKSGIKKHYWEEA